MHAEIKRNRENIEVNVFDSETHRKGKDSNRTIYTNKITRNPIVIAQVLMDLEVLGFPIEKSIRVYLQRVRDKDWLGL